MADIAFDTASDGSWATAASLTWPHTVSGPDPMVGVAIVGEYGGTDLITGVTFHGVSLAYRHKLFGATRIFYWYDLIGADTGTHDIVISASGSQLIIGVAVSLTGVGSFESYSSNTGSPGTLALNHTTIADNAWLLGGAVVEGGGISAGSGATEHVEGAFAALGIFSRGPITPAGATALNIVVAGNAAGIVGSYAPVAVVPSGYAIIRNLYNG